MKAPKNLLQDKILIPLFQFQKKFLSRSALYSACNKTANFIFKKSDDIPFILLFFNSVSVISSHLAQIGGLKKSKRENKDYLITQEWQEFGLDLALTIVPPFLLKNFLEKKLYSGQWTTKSAREKLLFTITPEVGVAKDELYNISHIKPIKETVGNWTAQITSKLKKVQNLPEVMKKGISFLEGNPNVKLPDPNKAVPNATMKQITLDFDANKKNKFKGFYNGSAYDEIIGQLEGITILATLAYTILASAVITPILKNKLANRAYRKRLEKMGETPESMERKKRFKYTDNTFNNSEIFNIFSTIDSASSNAKNNMNEAKENGVKRGTTFGNFERFSNITKSSGLRI